MSVYVCVYPPSLAVHYTVVPHDTSVSPYEQIRLRAQNAQKICLAIRAFACVTSNTVVTIHRGYATCFQLLHPALHVRCSLAAEVFLHSVALFSGFRGVPRLLQQPHQIVESKTTWSLVECWQAAMTHTHTWALPGFNIWVFHNTSYVMEWIKFVTRGTTVYTSLKESAHWGWL